MPVTYSGLGGYIKRIYGKSFIEDQMNEEMYLYDKIKNSSEKPKGEGYYFATRMARNQGGGAITELEALKTAGAPVVVQSYLLPKIFEWTIQFSGLSAAMASGEPGSFADIIDDSYTDGLQAARLELDRMFWGCGNAKVGTATATATAASATVDQPQWFQTNAYYDRYNSSNVYQETVQVTDIDILAASAHLTLAASTTVTSGDYFVRQGAKTAPLPSDSMKEMMGIRGIIDDGTLVDQFQGIYRASSTYYKLWRGLLINAGSIDITTDLLTRALDQCFLKSGKEPPTIVSTTGQRRKYLQLTLPQRRFADGKFDAGYSTLEFNGRPWLATLRAPRGQINILNLSRFEKFEVSPLALDDVGGTIKPLTGYDVAYSFYKTYANLGTKRPNDCGIIIHTLNEPTY